MADYENVREDQDTRSGPPSRRSRDGDDGGSDGGRPQRRGGPRGAGGRFGGRRRGRKVCSFCADKIESINYKDIGLLSRYVNERGRILPRRRTGSCAKHQRRLANSIKRARHMAMMPFAAQHVRSTSE